MAEPLPFVKLPLGLSVTEPSVTVIVAPCVTAVLEEDPLAPVFVLLR